MWQCTIRQLSQHIQCCCHISPKHELVYPWWIRHFSFQYVIPIKVTTSESFHYCYSHVSNVKFFEYFRLKDVWNDNKASSKIYPCSKVTSLMWKPSTSVSTPFFSAVTNVASVWSLLMYCQSSLSQWKNNLILRLRQDRL